MRRTNKGLTYVELVIVLAVMTVMLGAASISMIDFIAKSNLESTANRIYSDLRLAQSEALSSNKAVYVSFMEDDAQWCYGFSENKSCDCTDEDDCLLNGVRRVVNHENYHGVEIQKAQFAGKKNYTAFDPRNGFANANGVKNGTVWLRKNDMQMAVIVNRLGRIRFCSPTLSEFSKQCPKVPEL